MHLHSSILPVRAVNFRAEILHRGTVTLLITDFFITQHKLLNQFNPEYGGSMYLRNVGIQPQD